MTHPTLEDALQLAIYAHRGQLDKAGQPYILHPLRVMGHMTTDETRIVAVLHDVVEDSDVTLEDLRKSGYSETIITAVDCLTRRDDETYEAFVLRAKANPLARQVKLADIEDNMDIRRLNAVTERDLKRIQRYRAAWDELQSE